MTRTDAMKALLKDARSERASFSSYKRVSQALKFLSFPHSDTQEILGWLDYVDSAGLPHPWLAKELSRRGKAAP